MPGVGSRLIRGARLPLRDRGHHDLPEFDLPEFKVEADEPKVIGLGSVAWLF